MLLLSKAGYSYGCIKPVKLAHSAKNQTWQSGSLGPMATTSSKWLCFIFEPSWSNLGRVLIGRCTVSLPGDTGKEPCLVSCSLTPSVPKWNSSTDPRAKQSICITRKQVRIQILRSPRQITESKSALIARPLGTSWIHSSLRSKDYFKFLSASISLPRKCILTDTCHLLAPEPRRINDLGIFSSPPEIGPT